MKRPQYVVCLSLFFCSPVLGQNEVPRLEIFGGYSHNIGEAQGWNASAAVNANRWLGVVADFGGLRAEERAQELEGTIRANSFLFGPQFSYRTKRITPFARILFGVTSLKATETGANQSAEFADTGFSYGAGVGLDIRINRVLSIRALQADYIHTRFLEEGQHNGRVSIGIVLSFGGN